MASVEGDRIDQIERVRASLQRYNDASVLVDSTGKGEPVYEALCRQYGRVTPYPFTNRSKNDLITQLCMLLEQRKITLPKPELWPDGIDELENFEYSVTEQGAMRTGAAGSGHDDAVIALALAAWHAKRTPKPSSIMFFDTFDEMLQWVEQAEG